MREERKGTEDEERRGKDREREEKSKDGGGGGRGEGGRKPEGTRLPLLLQPWPHPALRDEALRTARTPSVATPALSRGASLQAWPRQP